MHQDTKWAPPHVIDLTKFRIRTILIERQIAGIAIYGSALVADPPARPGWPRISCADRMPLQTPRDAMLQAHFALN